MELVESHYLKKAQKDGVVLTARQLLDFAKKKKLPVKSAQISSFLKKRLETAKFAPVKRPKHFQTIDVLRPGVFFIDYADFRPEFRVKNDGMAGFLVAVENSTNRLFVSPCGDKKTESWLKAVEAFVDLTQNVRTVNSDRDSVAQSPNFRRYLEKNYGIKWFFLPKNSKSYLAERYIGFVKTKLSQAMTIRNTERWVDLVPPLLREYNTQRVEGTTYARQAVNRKNFHHFLGQLLKTDDPEILFNGNRVGPFENQSWNDKVFKFRLGEKVLLSRAAEWKASARRDAGDISTYHAFTKHSVEGGFSKAVYTVSGMQLRVTRGFKNYVAVYSLKEIGDSSMHFYENELRPVEDS